MSKIQELLSRVKLIEDSPELTAKFREVYGTDFNTVRTFIEFGNIKYRATKLIENLTDGLELPKMEDKIISVNTYSSDGVVVSSVDYTISYETKRDIIEVLNHINQNPLIEQCEINGSKIWGDIKMFDSTIDDDDRNEIEDDFDNFESDVQRIIIKKHGEIVFKAYAKWSDAFLTFIIE